MTHRFETKRTARSWLRAGDRALINGRGRRRDLFRFNGAIRRGSIINSSALRSIKDTQREPNVNSGRIEGRSKETSREPEREVVASINDRGWRLDLSRF